MEDMYGLYSSSSASGPHSQFQVQDYFPVDDLLDLSNDDLFSSSTSSTDSFPNHHAPPPPPPPPPQPHNNTTLIHPSATTDFANALCIPDMDPELEWLSRFNDDTITDFPAPDLSATILPNPNGRSFPSRVRVKTEPEGSESVRRCTHCASEKTPQWRTGPMGPKTLCNACGVRYKSGRLVPEYRPAASPTFVLTQHSNSHRKVMELRRQKEMSQPLPEGHHPRYYLNPNEFRVC